MSWVDCNSECQVINHSDKNNDNYNSVKRKNYSENLFSKLKKKTKLQDEINWKGRKRMTKTESKILIIYNLKNSIWIKILKLNAIY